MFDYFNELRRISDEINALTISDALHESMLQKLIDAVETIVKLSNTARKEGLLALEEAAPKLDDGRPFGKELSYLVLLIVDGTEPSLVEEIAANSYIMGRNTDYNALIHLIYIRGILSIQAGENGLITGERLVAMLPVTIRDMAKKHLDDMRNAAYDLPKIDPRDELCKAETVAIKPHEEGYFTVKLLDYAFSRLDDRCIQRILREVENEDLARLIRVQSGKTNKRIFDNLSDKLGQMLAEDAIWLNGISDNKSAGASYRVFYICMKLLDSGEITARGMDDKELEILAKMYELFKADMDNKRKFEEETRTQKNELAGLFREYTGSYFLPM